MPDPLWFCTVAVIDKRLEQLASSVRKYREYLDEHIGPIGKSLVPDLDLAATYIDQARRKIAQLNVVAEE